MIGQNQAQATHKYSNKQPTVDLTGQRFSQLTVLAFSHYSEKGYPHWVCTCDCGTTKVVEQHNLTRGNTKSCGCRRVKHCKGLHTSSLTLYEGVPIERAIAKSLHKNNTSGFRGVSRATSGDRWRVSITFKGVRYHLGYYKNFEDAVATRLRGEEMVDDFITEYLDNVVAKTDAEKAKQAKEAFENHIIAKTKAAEGFKRVICSEKPYASVAVGMTVLGGVTATAPLLVEGRIKGDVQSTGAVMVNGNVEGNVSAPAVYIPNGVVSGNIAARMVYCSNPKGQILGTISGEVRPYCRLEGV